MYNFKVSDNLKKILFKLSKKDRKLWEQIMNKIGEIVNSDDIGHYKNLRYDMKDSKRVHIGHFVLVFQFDFQTSTINFDDFGHHDAIYDK
jgi:YafQ family addiction module toxin component